MKKLVISDQAASGLTIDIANAFLDSNEYEISIVAGKSVENLSKKISLHKITKYDKSSSFRRIWTWIAGTWNIFWIFRKNKNAEFFIVSNPPLAPLLPLFLKNKFSLLCWDIWPDALVHTRTLSAKNPIVQIWKFLNRRAFSRAQRIFTISEGLADALTQYVPREQISIVSLWADTTFLKPLGKIENHFIQENNLANKFIVMYSGNIGNTHRVETLVDVAEQLKEHSDIIFVIVGDGGKKHLVEKRIAETNAKNVLMLPYQPREMLPHSLAAADIGVITLEESASNISVPSKTYSLLAVGAPLLCIAGEKSELATLVHKHNVGEIFSTKNISDIAKWILKVKTDSALHKKLCENSRKTSFLFTPENAKKFVEELKIASNHNKK